MSDEQNPLSEREMELVRLLATGATNREIAQELIISVNTVKVHLRNIYVKLDVGSRTEATMVAVREGWIKVPRTDEEEEEEQTIPTPRALPHLERWPRISMVKRISLVAAILLAVAALFLPQVLQSGVNGGGEDPIGGVFPTASTASSTPRWHTRAQMPTPRTNLAVVAHDGQIYAIGGISNDGATDKIEVYDPQKDVWMTQSPKPTSVGFVSAATLGDKIYVPGGFEAERQPTSVLEVYDPIRDVWESRAPMPEPLGAYGLAALDDQLYLFGGRGAEGYVDSVYRYDPSTDQWQSLGRMDQPKGFLGTAALGGLVYVVGGYDDVTEFGNCDAYDPAADSWTPCAPMSLRRGGLALVAVREHLYAIGGGMSESSYLAFNERYDPRTGAWNRIETPVKGQWRGLGAAFVKPHIYAIGGWNESNLSVNEAYQALFLIQLPIGP